MTAKILQRRAEPRRSLSYREALTMTAAQACGIDPDLAAEAGEDAKPALNLLRRAKATDDGRQRLALVRDAQNELKSVDANQHPELVNAISAKLLALQGRGGDTEVAHLTPGEMVLHPNQLSPRTRAMIAADLNHHQVHPDTRIVSGMPNTNEMTHTAQFASPVPPGENTRAESVDDVDNALSKLPTEQLVAYKQYLQTRGRDAANGAASIGLPAGALTAGAGIAAATPGGGPLAGGLGLGAALLGIPAGVLQSYGIGVSDTVDRVDAELARRTAQ